MNFSNMIENSISPSVIAGSETCIQAMIQSKFFGDSNVVTKAFSLFGSQNFKCAGGCCSLVLVLIASYVSLSWVIARDLVCTARIYTR